ncbi:MAG: hypothetical protein ACE5HQ_13655 [Gemmatimonadota bacterium]
MGAQNFLYLALLTFGLEPAAVEEMRGQWNDWLTGLFPSDASPGEAFQEMLSDPAVAPE